MSESFEKISLVGSEGSGKTCFLAGLRWLGSATENTAFAISGNDHSSQKFLNELHSALKQGHRPNPSHRTDDLDLKVSYGTAEFNIHIQDCVGEEFKKAAQENDIEHPIIRNLLESRYLIVCLDVDRDVRNHDPHSDRLDSLFTILHSHQRVFRDRKLVVLLTKADTTDIPRTQWTASAALAYLGEHNPAFARRVADLGLDVSCYFVSSLGSGMMNGERPDPYGYEQVFRWLGKKRRQVEVEAFVRGHSRVLILALGALLAVSAYFTVRHLSRERNRKAATSLLTSDQDKRKALNSLPTADKIAVVNEKLPEFERELEGSHSIDSLHVLHGRVSRYSEVDVAEAQRKQFVDLLGRIADSIETLHVALMETCAGEKNKDGFDKAMAAYMADALSAKKQAEKVRQLADDLGAALLKDDRNQIAAQILDYHLSNREILRRKLNLIQNFSDNPRVPKAEATEMKQAVADMGKLLSYKKYQLRFEQGGKLRRSDLESYLRVKFGNRDNEGEFKIPEDRYAVGAEPTWSCGISADWGIGDPINVEWKCNNWKWITTFLYASTELDGDCFTLLKLLSASCTMTAKNPEDFEGEPYLKVTCEDFPDADASRRYIEKYIVPGEYWRD